MTDTDSIAEQSSEPGTLAPASAAASQSKQVGILVLLVLVAGAVGYWQFGRGPAAASADATTTDPVTVVSIQAATPPLTLEQARQLHRQTRQLVEQLKDYPPVDAPAAQPMKVDPFASPKPLAADSQKQADDERAEAAQAVQALHLQSVLLSNGASSCLINNSLYRQGEAVDGFSIDRIGGNSVLVHRGPYRFEIRMLR